MTQAAERWLRGLSGVLHAADDEGSPLGLPDTERRPCARCGGPVPTAASSGRPRRGAKYCGSRCRLAAVNERRATARADLLGALPQLAQVRARAQADHHARLAELAEIEARIRRALSTLGLNPKNPRPQRGRRVP